MATALPALVFIASIVTPLWSGSPGAMTGCDHRQAVPEGWTLYKFPGPQFKGITDQGSAEHAYYIWVDRFNTLGLGPNVPVASTNGGESLTAIWTASS